MPTDARHSPRRRLFQCLLFALQAMLIAALGPAVSLAADEFDEEPIRYTSSEAANRVSRLADAVAQAEVELQHDPESGFLQSLLAALDIPASSQTLVFSQTSLQRTRISARTPRAIFFNDDTYVGYCQGGEVIEISTADPQLGTVFYTVDQSRTRATFTRQTHTCLACHSSTRVTAMPVHVVRSLYTAPSGVPHYSMGSHRIDQTSPLEQRWGGWYVSGTHGKQQHLGNLLLSQPLEPREVNNASGQNVTDLSSYFDTSRYPSPHSDLVALVVLEHQAEMHNLITSANYLARRALRDEAVFDEALGESADEYRDSTLSRIKNASEPLVEYMLFADEAPLAAPLQGASSFADDFASLGPFDSKGRSLRQFDLRRRVFKYPCSYLIYSESFDALPPPVLDYVYQRLWDLLSSESDRDADAWENKAYTHLSLDDRQAIREILQETKPGLPSYWHTR